MKFYDAGQEYALALRSLH